VKRWFDKHKAKEKNFEVGDLVLKWDKVNEPKGKHSKFQSLWLGPFQVAEKIGVGTYCLQNLRGEPNPLGKRPSPKAVLPIITTNKSYNININIYNNNNNIIHIYFQLARIKEGPEISVLWDKDSAFAQ
jgi:hypothetical protein